MRFNDFVQDSIKYIFLSENYDEDIEQLFSRKESDLEKKICYDVTKACEGVDRSKKEKEDMDVNVNGQEQQSNDGINRLNVDINDPNSASRLAEQIKQQMASQPQTGGSDDDEDDEPEDDPQEPEDLLKGYDENGNEIKEEDLPDDEPIKDGANKKTEL